MEGGEKHLPFTEETTGHLSSDHLPETTDHKGREEHKLWDLNPSLSPSSHLPAM